MPNILAEQRQEDVLIASVYAHCKKCRIEPPTPDRICRLVHTAIHRFDERLYDPKWETYFEKRLDVKMAHNLKGKRPLPALHPENHQADRMA